MPSREIARWPDDPITRSLLLLALGLHMILGIVINETICQKVTK